MAKKDRVLPARIFNILAVIFAVSAVLFAADTVVYRISHRNCTETVLAHAEHAERESGRKGAKGRGYTYTVEYSYEYGGEEYSCEGYFIEDKIRDINMFYNDKEIKIDPDRPEVYIIGGSADGGGYGLSMLLLAASAVSIVLAAESRRKASDK